MANILQVTNPSLNTEPKNIGDSQALKNPLTGQQIRNPADPSRVMRADGQESGKSGTATGEGRVGIAGYNSNYGAFIRRLAQGTDITELLNGLFSDSRLMAQGEEQVGELVRQLLSSLDVYKRQMWFGTKEESAAHTEQKELEIYDVIESRILGYGKEAREVIPEALALEGAILKEEEKENRKARRKLMYQKMKDLCSQMRECMTRILQR